MKPRYFPMLGTIFAFTAAGGMLLPSAAPALSTDVESSEDVEVLTRGPVHEAFAESVSYEPEAGLIVASAPPALIEELPPEQQPEGDNVTWIPGYWAWSDDQSDFLWISGIWRNIPPDREWVPGYWDELDGGRYQWVSGYWQDPEEGETTYIATAPPRSVDTGPNIDPPSADHTWIPGNWRYQDTRYVWSPGYYTVLRPNWTWVPSRYSWSPRGYVYVDGYWDYAVVNRGVLFAPVYYRRHVWETPGYYYTPSIVVSLSVFAEHLFIHPHHHHYYFGDYYAPRYRDLGFFASFSWHRAHRGYDPIWAYQRWHHRHDGGWERRYEDNYNYFRDNDRFRPPHTWAAMRALQGERFDDDRSRSRLFANNFDSYVKNPERGQKFKALNQERRQQLVTQRQEMREFARQRKEVEGKAIASTEGEGGKKSVKEKLRRSPIASRQESQLAENERPPQRPEGRKGRAGKAEAATGDETTTDDGKLTQKEKMRRAAGGGKAGEGATTEDTTDDGKLTQKEKARRAAGGGANKGGDGATGPDTTGPGTKGGKGGKGAATEDTTDDGKPTPKEKVRRAAGKGDGTKPEPKVTPTPQRKAQPEQKEKPQPKVAPQRKEQTEAAPERKAQPQRKQQVAPERKQQPKPEVREAPQKKQATPQRQVQPKPTAPKRKQQAEPEKKEPKEQASRQAPQRKQQAVAQRMAQPAPKARQAPVERKQASAPKQQQVRQASAPQRKQQAASQPKPQVRQAAAPQRRQEAAPQRKQQAAPQQRQQQQRQAAPTDGRKKKSDREKADA